MSPASLPNPLSTLPHPALGATQGPGSCLSGLWRLCGENIYLAQPNEVYIAYLCIKFTIFGRYISKVLQFLKMELHFGSIWVWECRCKIKVTFFLLPETFKRAFKNQIFNSSSKSLLFPKDGTK